MEDWKSVGLEVLRSFCKKFSFKVLRSLRGFVTKSGDFSSFQVGGNGSLREDWKFQVFVTKSGGIGSFRKKFS